MRRSNIWLSIDWDYFCREAESWGFAHAEQADFRVPLWEQRHILMSQMGIDLKAETDLSMSSPMPADFWGTLQRLGYGFGSTKAIVVGDSHKWAHGTFRRSILEGPPLLETRIVHFDAHHDLTYDIKRFEHEAVEGDVTCENWLLMTLIQQIGLKSLIVYPKWKGMQDWEASFGRYHRRYPELINALDRYTEPCVWPSPRVQESAGDVELVYICRSSPWTPPWHDEAFRGFVQSLETLTCTNAVTPFIEAEGINPLMPRPYNLKRAAAETEKSRLAQIQA